MVFRGAGACRAIRRSSTRWRSKASRCSRCCGGSRRGRGRAAQVSALFLIGYGAFRFIGEFAREPDAFLGLLALGLSMGQWLSLPMIAAGAGLFIWSRRTP